MEVSRNLEDETNPFISVNSIANSDAEKELGLWRAYQRGNLEWNFFIYLVWFSVFYVSAFSTHLSKREILNKRLTYSRFRVVYNDFSRENELHNLPENILQVPAILGLNKVLYTSSKIFLVLINPWLN